MKKRGEGTSLLWLSTFKETELANMVGIVPTLLKNALLYGYTLFMCLKRLTFLESLSFICLNL